MGIFRCATFSPVWGFSVQFSTLIKICTRIIHLFSENLRIRIRVKNQHKELNEISFVLRDCAFQKLDVLGKKTKERKKPSCSDYLLLGNRPLQSWLTITFILHMSLQFGQVSRGASSCPLHWVSGGAAGRLMWNYLTAPLTHMSSR